MKLSTTEGGKEGQSKAITSCKYLEERFQDCSKKGVALATSVETLGVDLNNEDQAAGGEGEGEKKEVRCKIFACQEKSGLPDKLHDDWCEEVVEDGFGPNESMERTSRWHRTYRKG